MNVMQIRVKSCQSDYRRRPLIMAVLNGRATYLPSYSQRVNNEKTLGIGHCDWSSATWSNECHSS